MPTVSTNGIEMYYERKGSGEPLLLVPGLLFGAEHWPPQMDVLASDYDVIAVDLRGHGDSAKPRGVPYTIEAFSDDLVQLMGRLGIDDAVLVGLSMGGSIVMRTALDHPEFVKALVLVDTSAAGVGLGTRQSRPGSSETVKFAGIRLAVTVVAVATFLLL